jgi:CubicO group peptidase (beta-lactamase class C family)
MAAEKIIGLSIGIVKSNLIYYTKGYGTLEINTGKKVDSLTNFHTASISKLFTATAIMQLAEQGKLNINNKLAGYMPEFKMKDRRYTNITIKQMLNHTSDLPFLSEYNWDHPKTNRFALKDYILNSDFGDLLFDPGTDISYSNLAFDILGYLIEKLSNQNFEEYMDQYILRPAGMYNSDFDYYKIDALRRSSPHILDSIEKKIEVSKIYPFNKEQLPCGTLNSCSYDLSNWMRENLNIYNDTLNTYNGIINHKTLLEMWTPTHMFKLPTLLLGLAWWRRESKEFGNYFFHVGMDLGYSSSLTLFPEKNFGIVVLCNGDYSYNAVYNKIPFEIELLLSRK